MKYFYKFRPIFNDEQNIKIATYTSKHSLLASVVLDYSKSSSEKDIVTNLRENYNKIIDFSKNDTIQFLIIKNSNALYQSEYKEMLKHILISDSNLPSNIDTTSIRKISDDLTFRICKK